jgi:hypothetical protein
MLTIDQFFLNFANSSNPKIEEIMPSRDSKVLRSLHSSLKSGNFLTSNQGELLIKILNEHRTKISEYHTDLESILDSGRWSKSFRVVEVVRKIYLSDNPEKETKIIIEFSFSSNLRKIMQEITKKITGFEPVTNGKLYVVDLDEKNIVLLLETFKNYKFSIDEKLVEYYNTIKSWKKEEILGQFHISSISNQNFQKCITDELGLETPLTPAIVNDRSVRYQYFCDPIKNPENLTENIAMRKKSVIWVGKNNHTLEEIFKSLTDLKRFPCLIVFESHDEKQCFEDLQNLTTNLEKNGIFDGIGIYFRFDNNEEGKKFNQHIAEKKYNCPVDKQTKIVGVQNGKIPKFLLKNEWKPMSVISLNHNLRNNKTGAYALSCDLIIYYSEKEPILV